MKGKKTIIAMSITALLFSGCQSVKSESIATPDKSNSTFSEEKPSEGTDKVLPILAVAALIGIVFAVAPAEAYK